MRGFFLLPLRMRVTSLLFLHVSHGMRFNLVRNGDASEQMMTPRISRNCIKALAECEILEVVAK